MNNELYNKLIKLKEELQIKSINNGKKENICSLTSIELMAKYKPTNKEDLLKISGLGESFVNNYGELFINEIKNNLDSSSCKIDNNEKVILQKLENRLVDINQRNRLLYSSKINKDYCLDLYKLINNKEIEEFITKQSNSKYKILDSKNIDDNNFKSVLKLIRQVNKIQIETGNNELYVAYPFVQGKMEQEDFMIKAPLILYPVELIRNNEGIYLKNDNNREILYNTTLILANNKFNGKNLVLPNNEVEEYNIDTYINDMLDFYSKNGFYINDTNNELENYFENKYNEFPTYKLGYLEIKKYMVLGIYSTYITSMYEDFEKMIKANDTTKLIKELLIGDELTFKDIGEIKEEKICYINELDYAQEKALNEIQNNDALVIQGPPGTGKSQTITSIIVQSILNNQKVLMVSEKKTALDVIYSRLGNISKFGIMIDDVKNKSYFYNQLNNIITSLKEKSDYEYKENENIKTNILEINNRIISINKDLEHLNNIQNKMYEITDFGASMYEIYNNSEKINLLDINELKKYNFIKDNINNISSLNYSKLNLIKNKFMNEELNNKYVTYMEYKNDRQFLINIKTNLVETDLIELNTLLLEIEEEYKKYDKYSLFNKILNKKNINQKEEKFKLYFDNINIKEIKNNIENIKYILNNYNSFLESKFAYDELDKQEQKYLELIIKLKEYDKVFINNNKYIYNCILYTKINDFEKNNISILNYINNFDLIREDIKKNIEEKKELIKKLAYNELLLEAMDLNANNKLSKIEEVVNRKRKMSVVKFMDKFKFELFDSLKIWLMTPEVVSDILPFEKNLFDLVIFDEASQLYVEKSLPAIYRAKKVIVAGDQKQLKPSSLGKGRILDEIDEEEILDGFLEYESLLDAARYKYKHTMLNYHYRSKYEELIAFSNTAFYDNKLLAMSNYPYLESPIERIKVDGILEDKKNIKEAEETVKLVKKILNDRKNNETIGVITFNISQMNLIEELIEKEKNLDSDFAVKITEEELRTNNGENIGFFVKNIETVQGDERDIIIFCIGYAKDLQGKLSINFGWLNQDGGENRLNVAISRAKNKIYVITSIEPEELLVENTKNNGPKLFKEYLRYVKAVSQNDKELVNSILMPLSFNDNNLEYETLSKKLMDRGYNVITNYGVSGNKIDIVVRDKANLKNILGIEFDGKLYKKYNNSRERDYHRQKYLETRGYKIYRIWSNNWWKNQEQELEKLIKYIDSLDK